MEIKTLKDALSWAEENGVALGHFNISDIAAARAIIRASGELDVPIIIGTSEGEADFIDVDVASALIRDMRGETSQAIFLNADHFKDLSKAKEAVIAGYDSIIFDGAKETLDTNIENTREAVRELKKINPNILIEGELGYIGESSKILEEVPEGAELDEGALPTPADAKRFVKETGVDLIAPAVGNLHGMFKNAKNPKLNLELIDRLRENLNVPMVLHGGSGISDDDFKEAIKRGMRIIHINTEIRIAWREGMKEALEDEGNIAPYKVFPEAEERIYKVVLERLKLFNGML